MKSNRSKFLLPLALALASVGAAAQSNVTIFGRVDASIHHMDLGSGASTTKMDNGLYTASRLGFRGTEDLGGGLSALFHLESGVTIDNGSASGGNRFFNRGAFVGLSSQSWGTLTLGRQYGPIFWPFLNADDAGPLRLHGFSTTNSVQRSQLFRVRPDALQVAVADGTLGRIDGGVYSVGATSSFENNLAFYKSPTFGGLTFALAAGAAEGYVDSGKVFGANVEYRNGPLYLGGAFNRKDGIVNGGGERQRVDEAVIGGLYALTDTFKLWGNVHSWKVDPGTLDSVKGKDFMVGASYWVGPGQIWANYSKKSVDSCTACDSSGLGIGYNHLLSKRTELYVAYGHVSNQANSLIGLANTAPTAPGDSIRGIAVGIAHQF